MLTRSRAAFVAAVVAAGSVVSATPAHAVLAERYGCDSPIYTGRNLPYFEGSAYGDTTKVVLASAEDFADGLAATTIAAATRSPLYVAYDNVMHDVILDEITEHGITQVSIVGGKAAVSADLEKQIRARGAAVRRIAGATRFETAQAVAVETRRLTGKSSTPVFLATGLNYPDAMAAGAAAAKAGGVVVLTQGRTLGPVAEAAVKSASQVYAIGGDAAAAAKSSRVTATTYVGADRFDTAVKVARGVFGTTERAVLSNGMTFGHSMVASTFAANIGAPLVFTAPKSLPEATRQFLQSTSSKVTAIGGTVNISEAVLSTVEGIGTSPIGSTPTTPTPTPTSPTPTPTTPPAATQTIAQAEARILELVNIERAKVGAPPLARDTRADAIARDWSETMARTGNFVHREDFFERLQAQFGSGVFTGGENIAYRGVVSGDSFMTGWMNSPAHRSNILNPDFTHIGIGLASDSSGRVYGTQNLVGVRED